MRSLRLGQPLTPQRAKTPLTVTSGYRRAAGHRYEKPGKRSSGSPKSPRPASSPHPAIRGDLAAIPRPNLRLSEQWDQHIPAQMQSSVIVN